MRAVAPPGGSSGVRHRGFGAYPSVEVTARPAGKMQMQRFRPALGLKPIHSDGFEAHWIALTCGHRRHYPRGHTVPNFA